MTNTKHPHNQTFTQNTVDAFQHVFKQYKCISVIAGAFTINSNPKILIALTHLTTFSYVLFVLISFSFFIHAIHACIWLPTTSSMEKCRVTHSRSDALFNNFHTIFKAAKISQKL